MVADDPPSPAHVGRVSEGIVYLVGTGPGDPGLMTARSLELVACAEVILYDRLIPDGALSGAPKACELRYVGKEPGAAAISQEEIERLLAARLQGATVRVDERGMQIEVRQTILGREVDALVRGGLSARAGRLVFTPQQVDAGGLTLPVNVLEQLRGQAFEYPLPALPGGLVPDRIVTEPGAVVVFGRLGPLQLEA